MHSDRGLSEAVSITLILCLVVILVLVISALFFGHIQLEKKTAYIMANISSQIIADKNILTVSHRAGDEADLNRTGLAYHTIAVYVDTIAGSNRTRPVGQDIIFKPGTTLYIFNSTGGYRATTNPADLAAPTALEVTACPVQVRIVDETSTTHVLIMSMDYTCTPTGPAPTVSGMNIAYGYRGWPIERTITGTRFLPGAMAKFNLTTGIPVEISASSCRVFNSSRMNCTFTLPTDASAPYSQRYNVVVTNPDGKQGMRANYFTVYSVTPYISTSTPSSGLQGTTVTITSLSGNYFQTGATVVYRQGAYMIPLTSVFVRNATSITGTLAIPADAPVGYYNVTVRNVDDRNYTRANRFRVISNAPTVSGLSNRTGYRGWTVIESITGTNFVSGARAQFDAPGLATIPSDDPCTVSSSTRMNCTFNLLGLPNSTTYQYNITVINPDGKIGRRANYFTLASPAPTISSSTPSSGVQGNAALPITNLLGNYFQPGATVTYWRGPSLTDPTTTVLPFTLGSIPTRTRITGTLDLTGAPLGYYNITVLNTDGKSYSRRNAFRVWGVPAPTIMSLSNITGVRGSPIPVVVTGTNIVSGARIRLYNTTSYVYIAPTGTSVPPNTVSTTFTVPLTSVPGTMNVRITNPDGQYFILPGGYTVT